MRIKSGDSLYILEVKKRTFDDIPYIDVNANFGDFRGSNNGIYLDNLVEFVADLDLFITNRQLTPKLTGTYDFELMFYSKTVN